MKVYRLYDADYDRGDLNLGFFQTEEEGKAARAEQGRMRRNMEARQYGQPEDLPFGDPNLIWPFDTRRGTQLDAFYRYKEIGDWSLATLEEVEVTVTVYTYLKDGEVCVSSTPIEGAKAHVL